MNLYVLSRSGKNDIIGVFSNPSTVSNVAGYLGEAGYDTKITTVSEKLTQDFVSGKYKKYLVIMGRDDGRIQIKHEMAFAPEDFISPRHVVTLTKDKISAALIVSDESRIRGLLKKVFALARQARENDTIYLKFKEKDR